MGNKLCECGEICKVSSLNNQLPQNYDKIIDDKPTNNNTIEKRTKEATDIKPNAKFVESYNSYTNFYCTLKQIIRIQLYYKAYLRRKKRKEKKNAYAISSSIHILKGMNDELISNTEEVNEVNELPNCLYANFSNSKLKHTTMTSFYSMSISMKGDNIADNNIKGFFLKKKKNYKFKGSHCSKKKEGFGIVKWEDGSKLHAIFKKSRAQGICQFNDVIGDSTFSGYYEDNRPMGYGIYQRSDEARFEGMWINHSMNGLGIEVWKDEYYYQGEFKDTIKNGLGVYRWPDGTLYQGYWSNNQMNGYGIMKYEDDSVYAGEFKNGLMNGFGEFQWTIEKKKYIGNYENDKKQGFGIFIWSFKTLIAHIGFWDNGNAEGPGIKINGHNVIYGVWKEGHKPIKLAGAWELKNYCRGSKFKHLAFLEQHMKHLIKFLYTLQ